MRMKIVLAIDSFKGSLTSEEAEQAVARSIRQALPHCTIEMIPIADGGEGTLAVLTKAAGATLHTVEVHNPCMEPVEATYAIADDGTTAFIEMAAASGLPLIAEEQRNPMKTTTYGTGELIRDALERGCTRFVVGIGGSATNDAGMGMLQALGFRFLDKDGNTLGQGGEALGKTVHICTQKVHKSLKNAHFIVACDVQNPLYGPQGAAHVYARQKGADDTMIAALDEGLRRFAEVVHRETGKDIAHLPGSGAAGGLGGGMMAFLNAELKSGADLLLEVCRFKERIADAGLIITGEGKTDRQSLMGKIPGKILQAGKEADVPVIVIAGSVEDTDLLSQAGFAGIYATKPDSMPLEEAMKPGIAQRNIEETVSRIFSCGSPGSPCRKGSYPQSGHRHSADSE